MGYNVYIMNGGGFRGRGGPRGGPRRGRGGRGGRGRGGSIGLNRRERVAIAHRAARSAPADQQHLIRRSIMDALRPAAVPQTQPHQHVVVKQEQQQQQQQHVEETQQVTQQVTNLLETVQTLNPGQQDLLKALLESIMGRAPEQEQLQPGGEQLEQEQQQHQENQINK